MDRVVRSRWQIIHDIAVSISQDQSFGSLHILEQAIHPVNCSSYCTQRCTASENIQIETIKMCRECAIVTVLLTVPLSRHFAISDHQVRTLHQNVGMKATNTIMYAGCADLPLLCSRNKAESTVIWQKPRWLGIYVDLKNLASSRRRVSTTD